MTDSKLSPAAQAIDHAIAARIYLLGEIAPSRQVAAAAISELLEQVLPEHRPHYHPTLDERHRKVDAWVIRDKVLRIVAELEAL